ncbi:MAG: thiamine-phosphate pyrophosphorylase, partial [Acidimicrobiaceae bacterium]|nr:thiamine-phosphate pyrophosphorylase [Acidimicrobiaceae bacterium]
MREWYTAGARRALDRAKARARWRGATVVEPIDLLAALVDEAESRAAEVLAEFGLDAARAPAALGTGEGPPPAVDEDAAD